jgi:uncharacterized protein YuzE
MRITYDPEADALAIYLRENAEYADAADIEEGVLAWLDPDGHIIGLEVIGAKERLGGDPLDCLSIVRLNERTCPNEDEPASPSA